MYPLLLAYWILYNVELVAPEGADHVKLTKETFADAPEPQDAVAFKLPACPVAGVGVGLDEGIGVGVLFVEHTAAE